MISFLHFLLILVFTGKIYTDQTPKTVFDQITNTSKLVKNTLLWFIFWTLFTTFGIEVKHSLEFDAKDKDSMLSQTANDLEGNIPRQTAYSGRKIVPNTSANATKFFTLVTKSWKLVAKLATRISNDTLPRDLVIVEDL